MRSLVYGVLAVGILAAWGSAEAGQIEAPRRVSVVIRTYTEVHSEAQIQAARRTAAAILERAGIEVAWRECALTAGPTVGCEVAPRSNELVVRIVRATAAQSTPHFNTLGVAFVDVETGRGALATVYADRVESLAERAAADKAVLLGRAMAHEIGHLLLGTNRHTSHGLMRASWSGADLRRNAAAEWLFASREGDMMRRGLARRAVN
jgi:hypothetical protein